MEQAERGFVLRIFYFGRWTCRYDWKSCFTIVDTRAGFLWGPDFWIYQMQLSRCQGPNIGGAGSAEHGKCVVSWMCFDVITV